MNFSSFKQILLFSFIFLPFFLKGQNQIEKELKKMEKYAKQCVDNYITYLNQIGDTNERRWLEDDIRNVIKDSFNGADSVWVYDNLNTVQDSLSLKVYLNKIADEALFPYGIHFDYQYRDIQLCKIEEKDSIKLFEKPYYRAKIYYIVDYKTKTGEIRQDHIDIFVRFDIQSSYPLKIDDRPFIVKTATHTNEPCPDYKVVGDTCTLPLTQLSERDKELLRNKAEILVKNYANALNSLDEKNFVIDSLVLSYFDQMGTRVIFDDLSLKIRDTIPYTPTGYVKAFQQTKQAYSKKSKARQLYLDYYFVEGQDIEEPIPSKTKILEEYFIVKVVVMRRMKVSEYPLNTAKLIFDVKFPIKDCQIDFDRNATKIVKVSSVERKKEPVHYWTLGGGAGVMSYIGDINPILNGSQNPFAFLRSSFTLELTKKLSPHWHARLGLTYGQIRGDDYTHSNPQNHRSRFLRNLHFRNNILELSAVGVYDWYAFDRRFFRRKKVMPYSFLGLAVLRHNPQAKTPEDLGGNWVNLQELGTEGQGQEGYRKPYSKIQLAIPVGIGVKFKLHERINVNLEANFRYTFTDYLDDVSGNYAEIGDLGSDLAKTMAHRSNENIAILRNNNRQAQLTNIYSITGTPQEYVSSDGQTYLAIDGYGRKGDKRGNSPTNDMYFSLGFKVSYFINTGNSYKRQQKINKRKEIKQQEIQDKIEFKKHQEELERKKEKRNKLKTDTKKEKKKGNTKLEK